MGSVNDGGTVIGCVIVLAMVFVVGFMSGKAASDVRADCERLGMFRYGELVFDCKPRGKP